jgi:L-seryl-tRNA(Ser) seleniumtransferase
VHSSNAELSRLPSVDRVLNFPAVRNLIAAYGRPLVVSSVRGLLQSMRAGTTNDGHPPGEHAIVASLHAELALRSRSNLRPVFNLTGTVLHTNLGRALLPEEAITAVVGVLSNPCNLELDLQGGARGDRDLLVEDLLRELAGAEAGTVVNNNAGAVMLILNSLALKREVIVSRGELIEIGGSFRLPDIMTRAGVRLREVGTTNRTHLTDYENAISSRTALIMTVHPSNYAIRGFTARVEARDLADLARRHQLPFAVDLGSGALIDLSRYGLSGEPLPQSMLAQGADLVSFSGDKILGGPQAGIVVGRRELIAKLKTNPLKRALRVDKLTLAALEAVLRLYRDPERLTVRLPTLRLLTREAGEILALANRLLPHMAQALGDRFEVKVVELYSQIGSGALPLDLIPSAGLALMPRPKQGRGKLLQALETALRELPVPVIGRVKDGAVQLDLRCLEDEASFVGQLAALKLA